MTRIVVNGRHRVRPVTGVERYAREISQRLADRVEIISPARSLNAAAGHLWEQVYLPARLPNAALLWSPANTGPLAVRRQVVTIHDLSPIDYPDWFTRSFSAWYRILIPNLARRAIKVITDSEFSRGRIREICRVPEARIAVVPGGVDWRQFKPASPEEIARVRSKYSIDRSYLLAIGALEKRKNLGALLQAWEGLLPRHEDLLLVIAGGSGHAFRKQDPRRSLPRVKWLGYVEDEELAALYSGALAFVHPAIYEGFGLCLLEAMSCGTPVIAAQAASLPEVVGNAGLLFDPSSPGSLGALLEDLIRDPEARRLYTARGLERARSFSWDCSAEKVWQILIEAAGC